MDYLRIKQDKRYLHTPVITNLSDIITRRADTSIENASKISNINVGFASPDEQMDFVDVLDTQMYMVLDRVKEVFQMYEPGMSFKAVCILDNKTGGYGNYHIPIFKEVDCLSSESKISPDKNYIEKLILKKVMIEEHAIFKVKGLLTDVVAIRLDVAESLLRRKIMKYSLDRIALESEK